MKSYRSFANVLVVALLLTLIGQAVNAQRSSKKQGWEYCAITSSSSSYPSRGEEKVTGVASICYFQSAGCRLEEVKFDIDLPEFRKKFTASENPAAVNYAARTKAAEGALSRAITKLGEAGWEMIGQGVYTFNNERNAEAIYFKRRR